MLETVRQGIYVGSASGGRTYNVPIMSANYLPTFQYLSLAYNLVSSIQNENCL